ncbi:MAG: orotidine-5'-phosphate decarboxylase [Gammaproteobacteria bacterium]|nr:orotidine-5'-phosphate decarboxylase [Gammaproteobacteria bacterium]
MNLPEKTPRVIVALDYPRAESALAFVAKLEPKLCRLKVGKELFTRAGPKLVSQLVGQGYDVFLDLKYHDIPNTTAAACRVAADLGVWMMNVHALGGSRMMLAAQEALDKSSGQTPLLIAVTILTSMQQHDLQELGISDAPAEMVRRLAGLAQQSGLDGVVCSAQEASVLRQQCGEGFSLTTPGIRPAGADVGDQKRVMTPAEALQAGSDYLVIGRPITQAADPCQALLDVNESIEVI